MKIDLSNHTVTVVIWTLCRYARYSKPISVEPDILDISFLISILKLIQFNLMCNRLTSLLKRFQNFAPLAWQSLQGTMFVHIHAQIFFASSALFHHTTCYKDDLCRDYSKSYKLVKLGLYDFSIIIHKAIVSYWGVFRHHVCNDIRNSGASFSISYLAKNNHSILVNGAFISCLITKCMYYTA